MLFPQAARPSARTLIRKVSAADCNPAWVTWWSDSAFKVRHAKFRTVCIERIRHRRVGMVFRGYTPPPDLRSHRRLFGLTGSRIWLPLTNKERTLSAASPTHARPVAQNTYKNSIVDPYEQAEICQTPRLRTPRSAHVRPHDKPHTPPGAAATFGANENSAPTRASSSHIPR